MKKIVLVSIAASILFTGTVLACGGGGANHNNRWSSSTQQPQSGGMRSMDGMNGMNGMNGMQMMPSMGGMQGKSCHNPGSTPAQAALELNFIRYTRASVSRGAAVYTQNCMRCHGENGMGNGADANTLSVRPAMLPHANHRNSDGQLAHVIRHGRSPMPAWKDTLADEQIWDVINFIRYAFAMPHGGGMQNGNWQQSMR
jgi:mono/diheme cytochrome c family protein